MKRLEVGNTLYQETTGYFNGASDYAGVCTEAQSNFSMSYPSMEIGASAVILILISMLILLWTKLIDFIAMNSMKQRGCSLKEYLIDIDLIKVKSSIWSILFLILLSGQISAISEVIYLSTSPIPSIIMMFGIAIIATIPRGVLYFNFINTSLVEIEEDSDCEVEEKQEITPEEEIKE